MKNLWFYRPFIIRNKFFCATLILAEILRNVINLLIPLSMGRFYELMYHSHSNKGFLLDALGLGLGNNFEEFLLWFVCLIGLKAILDFSTGYLKDKVEEDFIADIRLNAFQQQLDSNYQQHQQRATAKYLNRFSADFSSLKRGLSVGILGFYADLIFSIFAITFLININLILTIVLILGLVGHLKLLSFVALKRKNLLKEKQNAKLSYVNFISERLHSFVTIKIFERRGIEKKRFEKKMIFLRTSILHYSSLRNLENALIPAGIYLVICLLLISIFKFSDSLDWEFSGATSIAFILLIFLMRAILKRFLKVRMLWKNVESSIQKNIYSPPQLTHKKELKFYQGHIAFNFVSFSFDGSKKVLNNLSFEANKGTIIRICGKSCSGKTTVLKLIAKLYSPQQGTIFIDGQNINEISGVRKYISIVSDEFPFVGRDVLEAIAPLNAKKNKEKCLAILQKLSRTFQLKESISIHKKIINGGINLSQTEKKVLAYARAILSETPILLFDEPFSGISDQGTYFLGLFINEMKHDKTIVVVSARNCSSIEFDKTIDLDKLHTQFDLSTVANFAAT